MNVQKLAIAITLPIFVISLVYGAVYIVKYRQASDAKHVYLQRVTTPGYGMDVEDGVWACSPANGNTIYSIAHGFLGFPVFEVCGVPDNKGS